MHPTPTPDCKPSLRTDLALIAEWIQPNTQVLDLGCGDGALLVYLRECRRVNGYGIEIDDDNIVRCIQSGVNVIHGDLDKGLSDFADNTFDYVVMTQTLQAMRHPERILLEMLRVGRESIVTFPNFGHWRARLHYAIHGRMPMTRALPHSWYNTPNIHLCTLHDFEDLCHELEVNVLERRAVDPSHRTSRGMRLLPNLLGEVALYRLGKKKNVIQP